ncbi:excinuclease ABC subunit UvrA [Crocinitomix catalasitica]|uniref:excinuclease ABC subunit UvrA n=1 Tax=Crocinitomix catalasitica TaxID=184607 RepID=UPI000481BAC1|nr:excinuclease ABC subunit UvrA [Crocinitomix catalasitica]
MKVNKKSIKIKGARVHNLKNISLTIPHNQFVVITGLSGSGKSSIAFDTLFAEGQRRYVESLSSYARQFLGKLDKPDVDYIKGISPAIAIEQKVISNNPRSTLGTVTEIYDYLKVLFARIGKTYSPTSGKEVKKHTVTDVVNVIRNFKEGEKYLILAPWIIHENNTIKKSIETLVSQGYTKVQVNDDIINLDEIDPKSYQKNKSYIVIDRLSHMLDDEDYLSRIADSIQTSFYEGFGDCIVQIFDTKKQFKFSNRFELDGIEFIEPSVNFFSFNNPYGACQTCEGYGSVIGIDENLVIPDKNLSIFNEAVAAWRGEKMREWKDSFIAQSVKNKFPIHKPFVELSEEDKHLLWHGNVHTQGINDFFSFLETQSYKIQYRIMLSRYRGKTKCHDCRGTRLRKETNYVKVDQYNLSDFLLYPVDELLPIFESLKLDKFQTDVADRLILEIKNRLQYLNDVGLGYLTLNRRSSSVSGGESQRINLATSLGSSLVGSMYILDEPSIGLHPRDTQRLVQILNQLKAVGNTVIVVEHEEEIMLAADQIIDIGPLAGKYGGEVVFQGNHADLLKAKNSLTADYLTGRKVIPIPERRRKLNSHLLIEGARENNLKNITAKIPLNGLVCVSGVSGSGKSTLIKQILYPALLKALGKSSNPIGDFDKLSGDVSRLHDVEMVDQNPIGRSSRSNPATYVKAFDYIRELFSREQLSKIRGLKPGHFSYNVPGGRCEVCKGEGEITISMQFMADVKLTCEDCKGKRYTPETLDIEYKGKNIHDILSLSIEEALLFFSKDDKTEAKIVDRIQPLFDLGLGYLTMGQSSSTLSGGEAQRVKLASFLGPSASKTNQTLFIFDEPTTGLHFHDIDKLLIAFYELIKKGNSILVIEHNSDVLKCADWLIDIGPEGGKLGGNIVFEGTPEEIIDCKESYTGQHLKNKKILEKV